MSEQAEQTQEEKDKQWRSGLPEVLQTVAERHGKDVFIISYNAGCIQEMLIYLNNSRVEEFKLAVNHITVSSNILTQELIHAKGITIEQIRSCQADIERAAALQSAIPNQGSSKIILPH